MKEKKSIFKHVWKTNVTIQCHFLLPHLSPFAVTALAADIVMKGRKKNVRCEEKKGGILALSRINLYEVPIVISAKLKCMQLMNHKG